MSNPPLKLSIILPVYNEENSLKIETEKIIEDLKKEIPDFLNSLEILIIENGSIDNTLRLAQELEKKYNFIKVFHLEKPSYGEALKKGFLLAQGEYLVVFNIHFHDIEFLKKALKEVENQSIDIVIGSKTIKGACDRRPFLRRLITRLFNLFLKIYFNYKGTDTHGVKLLKREKILSLVEKCNPSKEIFDTELILRAQYSNLKIKEIPVSISRTGSRGILKRFLPTLKDLIILKRNLKK